MHPTQKPGDSSSATAELTGTPADTLRVAADYLRRHGWLKGVYFAETSEPCPSACAAGAIRYAVYGYANNAATPSGALAAHVEAAMVVLTEAINAQPIPSNYSDWIEVLQDCVAEWNDAPERTDEDVVAALLLAAEDYDRAVYESGELDQDRIPTAEGFAIWRRTRTARLDTATADLRGAL